MRQINYNLTIENSSSEAIELLDNETAILLTAERRPNNTPMTYSLSNDAGKLIRNKTFKEPVIRLSRQHFDTLKLEGNFAIGDSVKGDIFIGTWAEVTVIDLYKYLDFYYLSADNDKLSIIVGMPHTRHLKLEQIKDNVLRVGIVNGDYVLAEDFDINSNVARYIIDVYEKIKANMGNDNFANRQKAQVEQLLARVENLISVY